MWAGMHVVPQNKLMLDPYMRCPSIAQIPSVPAQSSHPKVYPISNTQKCRMHVIVVIIQSYTIPYQSRSLRSGAATCACSTITQTDHLIVHVVQTQWATGGNACAARCSHDDRPCRVQQLEYLRPRSHPCRRSKIQTGVDVDGGDYIAVACQSDFHTIRIGWEDDGPGQGVRARRPAVGQRGAGAGGGLQDGFVPH